MTDPYTSNEFRSDIERIMLPRLGSELTILLVTEIAGEIIRAMLPKYRLQFLDEITQEIQRGKKGRKR